MLAQIHGVVLAAGLAAGGGEGFALIVCPSSRENPRNSEGDTVRLRDGRILLAWTEFTGGYADHATARIACRTSADGGRTWSAPRVLQENIGRQNVMSVSFLRLDGEILLFFQRKNGPDDCLTFLRRSRDEGRTWSPPRRVSTLEGYHVLNNARVVRLPSGRILVPVAYTDDIGRNYDGQEALCTISDDGGHAWRAGRGRARIPGSAAMEPGVVALRDGRVLMILRTRLGRIYRAFSSDGGDTWTDPEPTSIVAPAAPASIARIPATGDLLLVWIANPKGGRAGWADRSPLAAAVSTDEGETWIHRRDLEADPACGYGYASVRFADERATLTYYVWHRGKPNFQATDLKLRVLPISWFYEGEGR